MKFRFAYLKLTLFYILIAMAISISFSFAIFNISSSELDRGLNRQTRILRDIPTDNMDNPPIFDLNQIHNDQLKESNDNLRTNLIYLNILILLLSTGAGYLLARRTLEPIKKAMEIQNRFTSDASHELRTPLTAMKSEIEVNLRDRKLTLDGSKKLLQSNLEEIGKLENLSNALLQLARHEDNATADFEKVSLEDILVEAYEKVESLANEKSISFETNFDSSNTDKKSQDLNKIFVLGNRQSLVELFVILIENAIKYSPKKSEIILSLEKDFNHAVVKIKDNGLGIKAVDVPHIFERFYRSDISRSKEKISGYGLGLSIAKNIVNFHRGTISVESTLEKGSEFTIKLPIAK